MTFFVYYHPMKIIFTEFYAKKCQRSFVFAISEILQLFKDCVFSDAATALEGPALVGIK